MNIILPSRYEDIDESFRGRLEPNTELIQTIQQGIKSINISGGIRFLPVFGNSGSGKTSAASELGNHLPEVSVFSLSRDEIESQDKLVERIGKLEKSPSACYIGIIDQFEELVKGKENIPTEFIERLSILDRTEFRGKPIIFLWLTTDQSFQKSLEDSCSRNRRLLLASSFAISGPPREDWLRIVEETFSFHNSEKPLSDFGIVSNDIDSEAMDCETIGECLERTAHLLSTNIPNLQNLSEYQIILLWPVADETRMQRVLQFCRPREGYLLNWDSWKRELNDHDRNTLPLHEYNRARLYFDMRLIPVRAADIFRLCQELDTDPTSFGNTYLDWLKRTHFYHVVSGSWNSYDYSPVRARESQRSIDAKAWYEGVTKSPTKIGRRLSLVLKSLGESTCYEKDIASQYSTVRADVFVGSSNAVTKQRIIEIKAFSSENTMPSTIKEQVKITLRRHAQFAGFLQRQ